MTRFPALTRRLVLGGGAALVLATAVPQGHSGALTVAAASQAPAPFAVEEATIDDLHRAIRDGRTTCERVIRAYVDRARAYNGSCTTLVTKDGSPIPASTGAVRTGRPVSFPTRTRAAAELLPERA